MKLHWLVFFKSVYQGVEAGFFIAQYCLVCKQHNFFEKLFLSVNFFEFFSYDDEDTQVVLLHLGLELVDYLFKTVVIDEFIDWDVDGGDTNTFEGLVSLFNVIKSFVVFD